MDITLLDSTSIKIKGKHGSLVVDPTKAAKTAADGILLTSKDSPLSQIGSELQNTSRVTIDGGGEYEVSGIKISGQSYGNEVLYTLVVDGLILIVGKANVFEKAHGKLKDCHVLLCNCDAAAHPQSLLSTSPRYAVLYGVNTAEVAKSLGKETGASVNKFSTAIDKLPLEMEVILFG